jgi:hypothetical protein
MPRLRRMARAVAGTSYKNNSDRGQFFVQVADSAGIHPLTSAEACKAWFRALPSTEPKATVDAVTAAAASLPKSALSGEGAVQALLALETLRKNLYALSEDLSGRYADKAVPLSDTQRAAYDSNLAFAWTLAFAYYSLIPASVARDQPLNQYAALVHQRALFWTAHAMTEHLHARQRFAEKDWDLAQEVLQSAGANELLETDVRDTLHPARHSSVAATYARLLLLDLCGARSFSLREFEVVRELAHAFENKAELSYLVADSQGVMAGAGEEKDGKDDRVKVIQTGQLLHFLNVASLSRSLLSRIEALSRGQTVDTPKLSNPPGASAFKALLTRLHSAWCARANQRQFPRRPRDEQVYCAFEPNAIYALMKRRPYEPPPPPKLYDHHEVANIFLDRDAVPSANARRAQAAHSQETWEAARAQLEIWQSQEESANGMSLLRPLVGTRVRQGQLIALRLGDAGVAMIGVVRWAEQASSTSAGAKVDARADPGQTVEIGVQLLPGLARAGAVRYIGASAVAAAGGKGGASAALILDHFARTAPRSADGLRSGPNTIIPGMLPAREMAGEALPQIEVPEAESEGGTYRYSERATIVLPAGWSREGEIIEFIDGANSFKLKLGKQTHRHGDFDRLHFTVAD